MGRFMLLRVREAERSAFYLEPGPVQDEDGSGAHWARRAEAAVLGAQPEAPMNLVGNGAARRIVGPVVPVWHDGAAYVAVDFRRPRLRSAFPPSAED